MNDERKQRCINLDWLEVYVLESNDRYPCNAEYFRRAGYLVREREYGTRVYKEMFEIVNDKGDPLIEVRRNPASSDSGFSGLFPQSSHIRLPNWVLYQDNPVQVLSDFLIRNDYIFKRIYRIDIAYDFVRFDSGDDPARFVRRYFSGQYRKINQCHIAAHGDDTWSDCKWNSISWGSKSSMVSTKLYNKSMELKAAKNSKPYIPIHWMECGLIDNPCSITKINEKHELVPVDVWRLEYSIKSECDGWAIIEMQNKKKEVKQHIPHRLPMYDAKDKLWQRFQDLTYHYFHFKYKEYADEKRSVTTFALGSVHSDQERPLKRKDRCRDKRLFYFDGGHEFAKVARVSSHAERRPFVDTLERRLIDYKLRNPSPDVVSAVDTLLKDIELKRLINYSPAHAQREARALQIALSRRMGGDLRRVSVILEEIMQLLNDKSII